MKKIAVLTGTRAEYGLLKPLIQLLSEEMDVKLQLIVTGMHLSPEFGLTYQEIRNDGFIIEDKVEMLMSSDTEVGIAKSIGIGLIGFADCFERLKPDIIVILGDRFEMLAAATAALVARIPIAHLHGGELTEGVIDEAIRHSITKMSHLHFVSTEEYRRRVIQLGEMPNRVYNVGALGVENVKNVLLYELEELEKEIGIKFTAPVALVTFHPVTLEGNDIENQLKELMHALDHFKYMKIIFTKANADTEGRLINHVIEKYVCDNQERCVVHSSLGQRKYLSALKHCDVVIGNSSSGIIEAPSFHVPTVNIGDRQRGRVHGLSVCDCGCSENEIIEAIRWALDKKTVDCIRDEMNPYEGENTVVDIVNILLDQLEEGIDIKKRFYDIRVKECE